MTHVHVVAAASAIAVALAVIAWKLHQTRTAQRRVQRLYAAAHHPARRLVEVLGPLRTTQTGQLQVVIDVRTGQQASVWLPHPVLGPGQVVLLVWMDGRWEAMEQAGSRVVRRATRAGHGHRGRDAIWGKSRLGPPGLDRDAVVREAEQALRRAHR